jgi:hypothetical protein
MGARSHDVQDLWEKSDWDYVGLGNVFWLVDRYSASIAINGEKPMQNVKHRINCKNSEDIAWAESEATDETVYLLNSAANAERLLTSIDNFRAGRTKARRLVTLTEMPIL